MNELLLSELKKMMFLVVSIYDHELGFFCERFVLLPCACTWYSCLLCGDVLQGMHWVVSTLLWLEEGDTGWVCLWMNSDVLWTLFEPSWEVVFEAKNGIRRRDGFPVPWLACDWNSFSDAALCWRTLTWGCVRFAMCLGWLGSSYDVMLCYVRKWVFFFGCILCYGIMP